jgi:DNA-binding transcriptional LysR family regulator
MELRHFRYFMAVVEEGHFRQAAMRLGMTQPPLSQAIRELEEELGVRLFERTSRRVSLTQAGRAFLGDAKQVLYLAEHARTAAQEAGHGHSGRLRLGYISPVATELLPRLLESYAKKLPDVNVELRHMTMTEQIGGLVKGDIDVGLLRPPIADDRLTWRIIHDTPMIVVLPQDHRLAKQDSVELTELAGERWVMLPQTSRISVELMRLFHEHGFVPDVRHEAPGTQLLVNLVAEGLGVAVVSATGRQRLKPTLRSRNRVVTRPLAGMHSRPVAMAWRAAEQSEIVQAFVAAASGQRLIDTH